MQASDERTTDHNRAQSVPIDPNETASQAPRHSAGTRRIAQNPAQLLVQPAASLQRFALVVTRQASDHASKIEPSTFVSRQVLTAAPDRTSAILWIEHRRAILSDDASQTRRLELPISFFLHRFVYALDFDQLLSGDL